MNGSQPFAWRFVPACSEGLGLIAPAYPAPSDQQHVALIQRGDSPRQLLSIGLNAGLLSLNIFTAPAC
jgi:hypothetical protein